MREGEKRLRRREKWRSCEWRSLDVQRGRGGEFVGRVERVERVDGDGHGDFR